MAAIYLTTCTPPWLDCLVLGKLGPQCAWRAAVCRRFVRVLWTRVMCCGWAEPCHRLSLYPYSAILASAQGMIICTYILRVWHEACAVDFHLPRSAVACFNRPHLVYSRSTSVCRSQVLSAHEARILYLILVCWKNVCVFLARTSC
jgi:hypothetical protein